MRYKETYRARPKEEIKEFPFFGASNLVMPIMATDADTLFARMMGLLFEQSGIWSVTARRPEMEEIAPRVQEFLAWAQENEIPLEQPIGDWLLDLFHLGTGILKQRYNRDQRKVYEWRELDVGLWQQQAVVLLRDAPAVHWVPLQDLYVPAGFRTFDRMPWCAEKVRLTWQEYLNRCRAGIYLYDERLSSFITFSSTGQVQQAFDFISGFRPSLGTHLELYEFWLDFDIDGDGWDEALLCTIHLDTQSYVRLDYNPFFFQEKPYSAARFMRDGNSFYGIGLGEMLEQFQLEITAMHNQRLDSGTVGNSLMLAVDKSNTDISQDEPIYPSKIWKVNKTDSIAPISWPTAAQSQSITNEQLTLDYAHRRDGVNDYIQGNPGPEIGYGTAYTTQQMLLNSTRRQGETLREVRYALAESGTRVLELYQQFNQHGKEYYALGAQDGSLVHMVLQFPLDLIRRGLRVSVSAIDAATSKDAQIRTNTLVLQQLMQFYQYYMQSISYMVNPQMPMEIRSAAAQMVDGASILMRRLLDSHGVQDADRMIPDMAGAVGDYQRQLQQLQLALQSTPPGRTPPAFAAGAQPGAGPGGYGGMGGIPQSFGGPPQALPGSYQGGNQLGGVLALPGGAQSPGFTGGYNSGPPLYSQAA